MLRRTLAIRVVCVLLIGAPCAYAQKAKTIMGDSWKGVVESSDEATREPGLRVRLFYKSKTQAVAGQRTKVNVVNRVQFLGRDEYTRMRETLKVEPSIPIVDAKSRDLASTDPFKLYLALEPENLDKGLLKWVEEWNKYESKKHGRVEIVDDMAQADVSLTVIWGKDDSFFHLPAFMGRDGSDPRWVGFGTGYLTIKDDAGLHVLWEGMMGLDMKEPERTAPGLGQLLGKKLKARKK